MCYLTRKADVFFVYNVGIVVRERNLKVNGIVTNAW